MPISEKDVAHVAELANLELTAEESARMVQDLNSILAYVAQLNELDTSSVPPMSQVGEHLAEWSGAGPSAPALRADSPAPSLDRRRVLAAAPDTDHVFFKVPKVIER